MPPVGPDDHVRGAGPELIVYGDYECPFCAALEARLQTLALRVCFRHFPVRSSHPRAHPAACAAEAASEQGAFWAMHDALFADQGRLEDPHLWARAGRLGLDLARLIGLQDDRTVEADCGGGRGGHAAEHLGVDHVMTMPRSAAITHSFASIGPAFMYLPSGPTRAG